MRTAVWGRWYQTGLKADPTAAYRLRLWVRATAEPKAKIAVWVTGTRKGTMAANVVDTGGRWVEVVIRDIKPAKDSLAIYLNLMHAPGTAWFDDVELTVQD